tara:strand:- start:1089 stop:2048 length:960 start_codon:yes stop_codon:yes gene_type:complete
VKILVLGGLGFLGGRIAQYFLNRGHYVLQGTSRDLVSKNFTLVGSEVVQTHWDDSEKLNDVCENIDLIIHASGMNAADCFKDPVEALNVNAVATANILQSAIKMNVKKFLYISSIHVYKDKLQGTISELDQPTNLHPYATSQRAGEDAVFWAQKNKYIDGIVVRISNGFGVPISKDVNCWMLLVNDLCRQAVEQKKLVLNSDGLQIRNFISISEICNALDFILFQLPSNQLAVNKSPINIGRKDSLSVLNMAKLIQSRCKAIIGHTPDLLVKGKNSKEKILHLDFKTNKLENLGYSYKHTIIEELDNLLIYCSNNFSKK